MYANKMEPNLLAKDISKGNIADKLLYLFLIFLPIYHQKSS